MDSAACAKTSDPSCRERTNRLGNCQERSQDRRRSPRRQVSRLLRPRHRRIANTMLCRRRADSARRRPILRRKLARCSHLLLASACLRSCTCISGTKGERMVSSEPSTAYCCPESVHRHLVRLSCQKWLEKRMVGGFVMPAVIRKAFHYLLLISCVALTIGSSGRAAHSVQPASYQRTFEYPSRRLSTK